VKNGHMSYSRCQKKFKREERKRERKRESSSLLVNIVAFVCLFLAFMLLQQLSLENMLKSPLVMKRSLVPLLGKAFFALLFAARRRL
jgi:hypothetical protein